MKKNITSPAIFWGLVFCLSVFSLIISCTGKQIPYDIIQYVNRDMLNISQMEVNALKCYASVTDENYTTDERVHEALKNVVVPYYKRFTELLREISPKTDELKQIHALYINGAESMYNGFKAKMIGIEKSDDNLINLANSQIIAGRNQTLKWKSELGLLLQKSAVTMK